MDELHNTLVSEDIGGYVYRDIKKFLEVAFSFDCNPLKYLRRKLPQWQWTIAKVENTERNHYLRGSDMGQDNESERVLVWTVVNPSPIQLFHVSARLSKLSKR